MEKIKSLEALNKLRDTFKAEIEGKKSVDEPGNQTTVKVTMATCGIASGSREVMEAMMEEVGKQQIENVYIIQTGCMGYCYAEPTVEITLPDRPPVVFGNVNVEKARDLITKYVINQELIDGIINEKYQKVE